MIPDEKTMQQAGARLRGMIDYLLAHIRQRRANPADDLTNALIEADVDGERLTDDEIVGFLGVLLIAGHITTTTLLTNTVLCLDANPAARPRRCGPTRSASRPRWRRCCATARRSPGWPGSPPPRPRSGTGRCPRARC